MTKDPFGFDMTVSSAKKNKPRGRRSMTGAFETSQRQCSHKGCTEKGQYRAPKSPDSLDDYLWFCKTHIREYNLKWNFFEGASETDIEAQRQADKVGERPTKPLGQSSEERAWARLGVDDPHQVLGNNATKNLGKLHTGIRRLPPTERRALEILEVSENSNKSEIRIAYKKLIKILHPDMNGGDRSQEELLSQVVWAWAQIKDSRSFK